MISILSILVAIWLLYGIIQIIIGIGQILLGFAMIAAGITIWSIAALRDIVLSLKK